MFENDACAKSVSFVSHFAAWIKAGGCSYSAPTGAPEQKKNSFVTASQIKLLVTEYFLHLAWGLLCTVGQNKAKDHIPVIGWETEKSSLAWNYYKWSCSLRPGNKTLVLFWGADRAGRLLPLRDKAGLCVCVCVFINSSPPHTRIMLVDIYCEFWMWTMTKDRQPLSHLGPVTNASVNTQVCAHTHTHTHKWGGFAQRTLFTHFIQKPQNPLLAAV